jgi:hypothetical protein
MWLTFSDAFLSIVSIPGDAANLKVRARRKGDIERIFKHCGAAVKVERTPGRDYLYRAVIPRDVVGAVVAEHVASISYPNFKNSVRDDRLHTACNRVWHVMADLQEIPPYARDRRRGLSLFEEPEESMGFDPVPVVTKPPVKRRAPARKS